jgi:hypothetical protein
MLTIAPGFLRARMSAIARCIRKKGTLVLTVWSRSQRAGVAEIIEPRSVSAAAFTSASMRPNLLSAASATRSLAPGCTKSAGTKNALAPSTSTSAATASPRALSRPQMSIASAPFAAASNAIARPTPWVEPVTISTVPARDRFIVAQLDFYLGKNRKIVPIGQASDPAD